MKRTYRDVELEENQKAICRMRIVIFMVIALVLLAIAISPCLYTYVISRGG